eukprot:m.271918 g.271918  ORF g.271918 m.271918 type:complete len:73 (+) comp54789_c0_seq6:73-291(+)
MAGRQQATLYPSHMRELRRVFALFDRDGSGTISRDELARAMNDVGFIKNRAANRGSSSILVSFPRLFFPVTE